MKILNKKERDQVNTPRNDCSVAIALWESKRRDRVKLKLKYLK